MNSLQNKSLRSSLEPTTNSEFPNLTKIKIYIVLFLVQEPIFTWHETKQMLYSELEHPKSVAGFCEFYSFFLIFQEPSNIQSFTDSILNESPLSLKLSEKNSTSEKICFVIWFPLIAISWLLMNWFDVRKPGKINYSIINYILAITLKGALAYFVVWWGTVTGYVLGKAMKSSGLF